MILRKNTTFLPGILGAGECGGDVSILSDGLPASGPGVGFEKFGDDLQILLRPVLFRMQAVCPGLQIVIDTASGELGRILCSLQGHDGCCFRDAWSAARAFLSCHGLLECR